MRAASASVLGTGALWFLTEPEEGITVTMANRAMSADEWAQYAKLAPRKRRPQSRLEALEEEIRKDTR